MRHITFLVFFSGFVLLACPAFAQFNNNIDAALTGLTDAGYRQGRLGIGFTNPYAGATGLGTALGTSNRARFAVRDGILAHHVSGEIGTFGDKWLGLGIGNPGGPAGSPKPYGLAIADTGSVAFFNVLRENFNGVIRKNTVAGFGAEYINANRFIITGVLIVVMGVLLVLGML